MTDGIRIFRPPTNIGELRSILGLCNMYRRLVPYFSRTPAPLNEKLNYGDMRSFEFDEF